MKLLDKKLLISVGATSLLMLATACDDQRAFQPIEPKLDDIALACIESGRCNADGKPLLPDPSSTPTVVDTVQVEAQQKAVEALGVVARSLGMTDIDLSTLGNEAAKIISAVDVQVVVGSPNKVKVEALLNLSQDTTRFGVLVEKDIQPNSAVVSPEAGQVLTADQFDSTVLKSSELEEDASRIVELDNIRVVSGMSDKGEVVVLLEVKGDKPENSASLLQMYQIKKDFLGQDQAQVVYSSMLAPALKSIEDAQKELDQVFEEAETKRKVEALEAEAKAKAEADAQAKAEADAKAQEDAVNKAELDKLNAAVGDATDTAVTKMTELRTAEDTVRALKDKIQGIQDQIYNKDNGLMVVNNRVSEIEDEIARATDSATIDILQQEKDAKVAQATEIQNEINQLREQKSAAESSSELKSAEENVKRLKQEAKVAQDVLDNANAAAKEFAATTGAGLAAAGQTGAMQELQEEATNNNQTPGAATANQENGGN